MKIAMINKKGGTGKTTTCLEALSDLDLHYEFIFFDCPHSLSLLSINTLVAADAYLIPVTAEYLALEGLISMIEAVKEVKAGMEINPHLLGIAFTMVNPNLINTRQIIQLVREHYGKKSYRTEIHRYIRLTEAPSFGKSIFQYVPRSNGAKNYAELAQEILERCGVQKRGEPKRS